MKKVTAFAVIFSFFALAQLSTFCAENEDNDKGCGCNKPKPKTTTEERAS